MRSFIELKFPVHQTLAHPMSSRCANADFVLAHFEEIGGRFLDARKELASVSTATLTVPAPSGTSWVLAGSTVQASEATAKGSYLGPRGIIAQVEHFV